MCLKQWEVVSRVTRGLSLYARGLTLGILMKHSASVTRLKSSRVFECEEEVRWTSCDRILFESQRDFSEK